MKKSRILCLILSAIMLVAMLPSMATAADTETSKPTIFIIGDSMAASYEEAKYPRMGWGQAMPDFFTDEVVFDNRAVAGTSSRSFYNVYWPDIVANMKEGDYLLFTFGANDSKKDQEVSSEDGTDADLTSNEKLKLRNTDPTLPADSETGTVDGETKYSFKYFMNKYITETKAEGATPIMLTPPERRDDRSASNPQFAVDTMGLYDDAIIGLAAELNGDNDETNDVLCLSDVGASSLALYKGFGDEASKKLFCYLNDGQYETDYWENDDGTTTAADGTHFRDFGAAEIAGVIVEELIKNGSDLTQYMKNVSTPIVYNSDADAESVGIGFKKTEIKGKGETLYPRAQFINKENEATTIQVVTARYDNAGKLAGIVSNDKVDVPAQSVVSFDTNFTMPSETEPGQIKMFVWKDFDSLLPQSNDLQKWTFTEWATSDDPVFEETFDDYSVGTTLSHWTNNDYMTVAPVVSSMEQSPCLYLPSFTVGTTNAVTYESFTATPVNDENYNVIFECDVVLGNFTFLELRNTGSNGVFKLYATSKVVSNVDYRYSEEKGKDVDTYDSIGVKPNEKFHLKAVIKGTGKTADIYVNNSAEPVLADIGIYNNRAANTTAQRIYLTTMKNQTTTPTYIDNISIYRQKIDSAN